MQPNQHLLHHIYDIGGYKKCGPRYWERSVFSINSKWYRKYKHLCTRVLNKRYFDFMWTNISNVWSLYKHGGSLEKRKKNDLGSQHIY